MIGGHLLGASDTCLRVHPCAVKAESDQCKGLPMNNSASEVSRILGTGLMGAPMTGIF